MSRRHVWDPICDPPRDLVRPVRFDPAGRTGPTRGQAAGMRCRQTSHGLYVPAAVDASRPEQRILEASMLLPAGGAVTGWAALRLLGGNFFDGLLPDRLSPNETRMRLIWVIDAGLPRPLVNRSVWTRDGRRLGIPDLLDVEAGVVGEFDGADHRKALRQSSDVGREAGFRDHLLELYRVVGVDLPHRQRVVARMTSARNRARWLPADQRPWMVLEDDPADSLDAFLDERDRIRELHQQWERDGDPDIRDIVGGDPW